MNTVKISLWIGVLCWALQGWAQHPLLLRARSLSRWDIPAGNYSGITPIGPGRYAVVSDKAKGEGFYVFAIEQDPVTGQVDQVNIEGFYGLSSSAEHGAVDAEGVAFLTGDSTVWVSDEAGQTVKAYWLDGKRTGQELAVPEALGKDRIYPNYGFEALGYDSLEKLFWTVSENALKTDGGPSSPSYGREVMLRMQSFTIDGRPACQLGYKLDKPYVKKVGRMYAYGVVALCPTGDGSLLVMEREFDVAKRYLKSKVYHKIYRVYPELMEKELWVAFETKMKGFSARLANYEGMCMGRKLVDGRQTYLLISDSQGRYGKRWCHLKDWIRVIVEN